MSLAPCDFLSGARGSGAALETRIDRNRVSRITRNRISLRLRIVAVGDTERGRLILEPCVAEAAHRISLRLGESGQNTEWDGEEKSDFAHCVLPFRSPCLDAALTKASAACASLIAPVTGQTAISDATALAGFAGAPSTASARLSR